MNSLEKDTSTCKVLEPPSAAARYRLSCTCATGLAGDGTFCETQCSSSAVFAGQTFDCGGGARWHGAVCTVQPAGGASQKLVCDDMVWRPVFSIADACEQKGGPDGLEIRGCPASLTNLPVDMPNNTRVLVMRGTSLSSVRRDFGWDVPELERLELTSTPITRVPAGSFNGLSKLSVLALSNLVGLTHMPGLAMQPLFSSLRLAYFGRTGFSTSTSPYNYPLVDGFGLMPELRLLAFDGQNFRGPSLPDCIACEFRNLRTL